MICLISVVLMFASLVSSGVQHSSGGHMKKGVPSVYITFEKIGELQSEPSDDRERTWLRLHNNTRWPIRLDMGGVPAEYGDAKLFFDGLLDGEVIFRNRCHGCSTNLLGSGKSMVFNVPKRDLGKGRSIRVKFSYGWEEWADVTAGREPEHYVYFSSSSLPVNLQSSN